MRGFLSTTLLLAAVSVGCGDDEPATPQSVEPSPEELQQATSDGRGYAELQVFFGRAFLLDEAGSHPSRGPVHGLSGLHPAAKTYFVVAFNLEIERELTEREMSDELARARNEVVPLDGGAYHEGRAAAEQLVAAGQLALQRPYGEPTAAGRAYEQALREAGIQMTGGGCTVAGGQREYNRGFGEVMEAAIAERHGPDFLHETRGRTWAAELEQPGRRPRPLTDPSELERRPW